MKRYFKVSKGHAYLFSAFRDSNNWLLWIRLCYVLNRRMALRTQNLPSARLKRRLWRSRWSDVSSCRWVMQNHFQHPGNRKKWLSLCRLSNVISSRMALRTHNLPSERIKKRLWWNRWSHVSRCQIPCEIFFWILCNEKSDLTKSLKRCFK
jgi:hypothetical protein